MSYLTRMYLFGTSGHTGWSNTMIWGDRWRHQQCDLGWVLWVMPSRVGDWKSNTHVGSQSCPYSGVPIKILNMVVEGVSLVCRTPYVLSCTDVRKAMHPYSTGRIFWKLTPLCFSWTLPLASLPPLAALSLHPFPVQIVTKSITTFNEFCGFF